MICCNFYFFALKIMDSSSLDSSQQAVLEVSFDDLIANSYALDFPTKNNLVQSIVERGECTPEDVARDASGTRVITHDRVLR